MISASVLSTAASLIVALSPSSPHAVALSHAHPHIPVRRASAHTARVLAATDTARLRYIKSSGSLLFEEGLAKGRLPGNMRAHCNLGATVRADFTIYVRGGGTIKGSGTATPHGSGIYESFAGTLTVTGGSGRYLHAHGHAGLYGTFNRRTYALTVQTTGSLSY